MKWLVRVWLGANILVLLQAMLARETPSSGGELAMLMFLLNLPSSILTGIGLDKLDFATSATTSHSLRMLWIGVPFFILGTIQCVLLQWLIRKISR